MRQFISLIFATALLLQSATFASSATAKTNPPAIQRASAYWVAEYFNNTELRGRPALRQVTRRIFYNWGYGSPSRYIRRDNFSARWTWSTAFIPAIYRIYVRMDDGVRVYVDNRLVLDDWREGPARDNFVDVSLAGFQTIRVEYFEKGGLASAAVVIQPANSPLPPPLPTSVPIPSPIPPINANWRGEYYNNIGLIGNPVLVRGDNAISFDWGNGSPDPVVPSDNFSARWTGRLPAGIYRLDVRVDDGVRVYVNGGLVIDSWFDGAPRTVSANLSLINAADARIEYYDRNGGALIQLSTVDSNTPTTFTDWKGEYYNNTSLSGTPALLRNDTSINFDFGSGGPGGPINVDNFSARWSRNLDFNAGTYQIDITVDDAMRVYIDDGIVIDEWREGGPRSRSAQINLSGGTHRLRVEFYELGGGSVAKFAINRISDATATPVVGPTITPVPF